MVARESCLFAKNQDHSEYQHHADRTNHFANDSFFIHFLCIHFCVLKCSFCKQNNFSDNCTVVIDLDKRKEIVWKNCLCFKCLYSGHSIKSCQKESKYFSCKSHHHLRKN